MANDSSRKGKARTARPITGESSEKKRSSSTACHLRVGGRGTVTALFVTPGAAGRKSLPARYRSRATVFGCRADRGAAYSTFEGIVRIRLCVGRIANPSYRRGVAMHRGGCHRGDHPAIGRRELLQVGGLSLVGAGLADLLRLE